MEADIIMLSNLDGSNNAPFRRVAGTFHLCMTCFPFLIATCNGFYSCRGCASLAFRQRNSSLLLGDFQEGCNGVD
jgi:hypothetical protein